MTRRPNRYRGPRDVLRDFKQYQRLFSQIDQNAPNGCWIWTGQQKGSKGPGEGSGRTPTFRVSIRRRARHLSPRRLLWEWTKEQAVPPGMVLAATCHNRLCVNPEHAQPARFATMAYPMTHCRRGHKLTPANVYITSQGRRACRKCIKIMARERRKKLNLTAGGRPKQ